ncbi:MAG: KH domain-containing protein [Erysipelothrix sp.]|jgi:predicted RNA-binding protein YlqC (UPF0109 family)|nr:KH domain-containing protein [Erysipelothrix sp.]
MTNLEQALMDLVTPLVEDKAALSIKSLPTLDENEVILMVYAKSEDIARLIGRQGSMATALRQVMSIPARLEDKKIVIKFEDY